MMRFILISGGIVIITATILGALCVIALCRAKHGAAIAPSPASRSTPLGVISPCHAYPTAREWRRI